MKLGSDHYKQIFFTGPCLVGHLSFAEGGTALRYVSQARGTSSRTASVR